VSRRAKVAWRKRNIIRKIRMQASRESRKELAVARREMIHRVKVARHRGRDRKIYDQDNVAPRTLKGRTSRMTCWKGPECNNVMRDRGLKQQLWGNERINNSGIKRQLLLIVGRTSEELDRKAFGLEFLKRSFGNSSGIQGIKTGPYEGVDPSKPNKKAAQRGAGNVENTDPHHYWENWQDFIKCRWGRRDERT
jgi:hypothetical protein